MRAFIAALASLCLTGAAPLHFVATQDNEVDVALVLAADASSSMSEQSRKMQRDGYRAALTSPGILEAIVDGKHHRIAVTFFDWGSAGEQRLILPWTVIDGPESAARAASAIGGTPSEDLMRTSISKALDYAGSLLAQAPYKADRQVIDVSGDGPNNDGQVASEARDNLLKRGIIINGLPIIRSGDGSGPDWLTMEDLDEYYEHCVIGGDGSFIIAVRSMSEFKTALQTKLVLEIAGNSIAPKTILASQHRDWSGPNSCHLFE